MTPTAVLMAALAASAPDTAADPNTPPDIPVAGYPDPAPEPDPMQVAASDDDDAPPREPDDEPPLREPDDEPHA